ncbi:MAG TPA: NAD-dependent epimerase/dehydratase family protein [Niabella sp.]|nr:NAD-dependent epimerase/dehydratase family protein [Niabella sp.]HQW14875.1 NAD-dependent epimerase/dehydratase family protein [Niabella sp.]HQX18500.1 NAD-dependent epimerase/dehydratase family protein [Niabella sp.]HQX41498.1 NAD-dependent epimerase/dehydratase family protein [Niabella sp.]HRB06027.1 NAD-dependent epimerase/dehydratase family protein [Niabella sp.]
MKVLVTGASGFIGNHVVRTLLQQGHTVIASSTDIEKASSAGWFSQVIYIPLEIGHIDKVENLFEFFHRPDCLIHLAWAGLPNYKSAHHTKENLPAHKYFLEKIISEGLKNINIIGTCFEYGMQEGALTEEMVAAPDNQYAIAKNELRLFITNLQRQFQFDFKWLRLFYMYGSGQASNSLIPQLDAAIKKGDQFFNMSGGEQIRDFLPVETVAKYIVAASLQSSITGIVNICSNQPICVKDFVMNYLRQKKHFIHLNLGFYPYADFEPMSFWGDNEKLKKIIR